MAVPKKRLDKEIEKEGRRKAQKRKRDQGTS